MKPSEKITLLFKQARREAIIKKETLSVSLFLCYYPIKITVVSANSFNREYYLCYLQQLLTQT